MNSPKQSLYINLLQDLMFKTYFSKNRELLLFLLKAFLPLPEGKAIQSVNILNHSENKEDELAILDSFLYPTSQKTKLIVLDLRVRLNTGELVNVEMQSVRQKSFLERMLYYWSRLYTETLNKGEDYRRLYPAYSLVFTNFNVFPENRSVVTSFSVRSDQAPHFTLTDHLKIVLVELSRFQAGNLKDLFDLRDLWCYILKESAKMGLKEWDILFKKGREMKMAMQHLKALSKDQELRWLEISREKAQRDLIGQRAYAREQGREEGREQGREQGIKQGMEQGKAAGRKEGMQKEREKIALKMLNQGYDLSSIEKITGFSKKKIQEIQKK